MLSSNLANTLEEINARTHDWKHAVEPLDSLSIGFHPVDLVCPLNSNNVQEPAVKIHAYNLTPCIACQEHVADTMKFYIRYHEILLYEEVWGLIFCGEVQVVCAKFQRRNAWETGCPAAWSFQL